MRNSSLTLSFIEKHTFLLTKTHNITLIKNQSKDKSDGLKPHILVVPPFFFFDLMLNSQWKNRGSSFVYIHFDYSIIHYTQFNTSSFILFF